MSGSFLKNKWTSCLYILFSWSWVRTHTHIGSGFEPVRWQNHKLQIYKLNIFSQDKTEGKHVWGPSSNDSIMTSLVPWSISRKKIHQNQSRSLSQTISVERLEPGSQSLLGGTAIRWLLLSLEPWRFTKQCWPIWGWAGGFEIHK